MLVDASDYVPVGSFFVNFAGGRTIIGSEDCVTISLLEDAIIESDQQFSAVLTSVNALVDVNETVIVINNTNSKLRTYIPGLCQNLKVLESALHITMHVVEPYFDLLR